MTKFSLASRQRPTWYASELRRDMEIDDTTAINLQNAMEFLKISFKEATLSSRVLGACKVVGLKKMIVVSEKMQDPNQKRFTISHEIGHVIAHNGSHKCQIDDFKMWLGKKDIERAANQFAAELLLPESAVLAKLRLQDVSLDLAKELSQHYGISLLSSTLRLIELCDENTALFYQKGDSISWSFLSPDCKLTPKTGKVDIDSLSYHATEARSHLQDYVNPILWFEGDEDKLGNKFRCHEQTWYFRHLNIKLSVVRLEEQ